MAKGRGRPSAFQPEFCEAAYSACLLGATDDDLAELFGVARSTISKWKKEYPDFSDAIKRGKRPADAAVANALFERATGAEWVEEQAFKVRDIEYVDGKRSHETERIEVVEVTRRAPPDTPAAIFWLKNRRPDMWRDKIDTGGAALLDVSTWEEPEFLERVANGEDPYKVAADRVRWLAERRAA